ncbi:MULTISPECIES: hypothetical protein [Streptomyces]|uniref:hypothetical protein n=1 Tax=Streptomyces TaxID=1883 RepID=UPI00069AB575|nr:hypothetical protein [Streptomyces sp. SID7805]MYU51297.1 hypothetical protein [Streptomyces sp. SID7805]WSK14035.1 hypothetical protein OG717_21105 [Streptomyces celluloflavus]
MTTTNTTAPADRPAVGQAEQEAAEAEQLLAALEERVRDGDEHVTSQQLADARELGRFATLRAEAARRKADRAAAKAAEQERQRKTERALALLAEQSPQTLAATYATARDALAAFLTASNAFDGTVTKAAALLRSAGAPQCAGTPEDMQGPSASPTAPRWYAGFSGATVDLGQGGIRHADGAAARLAVLLDDLDRTAGIRTAAGHPAFTRTPVIDQARRARGALSPQLDCLAATLDGATK